MNELKKMWIRKNKYQYLHLMYKIEYQYKCLNDFSLREDYQRLHFYLDWLNKINKKYKYA